MFDRETMGRSAKAEISLFDAIHAEILEHRMAEKEKHRLMRKNARKYKELPEQRRARKIARMDHMFGFVSCENCPKYIGRPDSVHIRHRAITEAEKIIRADWELESADIEINAELDKRYAEIRAEYHRDLHEWLKYA